MKEWLSSLELADLRLPGLPKTTQGMSKKAEAENWQSRPRSGRGGGKEYNIASLPVRAKEELARRSLSNVPERRSKEVIERPDDADLSEAKSWQRETAEARAAVLAAIDNLAVTCGKNNAIKAVLNGLKNGTLEPSFAELIRKANAKTGGAVKLSRASLFNWYKMRDTAGLKGLTPVPAKDEQVVAPAWFDAFARLYFRPQKPSLSSCVEMMQENMPALAPVTDRRSFTLKKSANCWRTKDASGRAKERLSALTFPAMCRICGPARFIAPTDTRSTPKLRTRSTASLSALKLRQLLTYIPAKLSGSV